MLSAKLLTILKRLCRYSPYHSVYWLYWYTILKRLCRYSPYHSVYWLYWYKSTNTEALVFSRWM